MIGTADNSYAQRFIVMIFGEKIGFRHALNKALCKYFLALSEGKTTTKCSRGSSFSTICCAILSMNLDICVFFVNLRKLFSNARTLHSFFVSCYAFYYCPINFDEILRFAHMFILLSFKPKILIYVRFCIEQYCF